MSSQPKCRREVRNEQQAEQGRAEPSTNAGKKNRQWWVFVFLLIIPKCYHQDYFPLHCGWKNSQEWLRLKAVHILLVPLHLVLNLFQILKCYCSKASKMWRAVNMKTVITSARGLGEIMDYFDCLLAQVQVHVDRVSLTYADTAPVTH